LDLAKPSALEIVRRLITRSDVLVHNLKPGAMEKLGLGYEVVCAANPRMLYAAASTFGPKGSRKDAMGVDLIAQAESGIMSVTGRAEDGALPVGAAIADALGGINLAFAVIAALYARERTGRGQAVQVSLVGGLLGLQAWEMQHHLLSGAVSPRAGRSHPLVKTLWQTFAASDGDFVVAEVKDSWRGICRAVGRPDLADDERFHSVGRRLKHRRALLDILEAAFRELPVAQCVQRLRAEGVLAAPVRSYQDIARDDDTRVDGYIRSVEHPGKGRIDTPGPFLHFSETPPSIRRAAPALGEHTTQILAECGYEAGEIERLRGAGAIA